MIRTLLKLVLLVVVLVGIGAYALGYWTLDRVRNGGTHEPAAIGTAGHPDVDKAREAGAEIGEKTALAADRARATLGDAALTTKIKSKMALDDVVHARRVDVTTDAGVVTLSGTVSSREEHDRAVRLAKETAGVTSVTDHLQIR